MEINPFSLQPIKVLIIGQSKGKCADADKLYFQSEKIQQPQLSTKHTYPGQ